MQSVEQLKNYGKGTKELKGNLKVAIPETLLTNQMQPVLKAFREQAPGVKLSLQALNCYTIRDQLINGGADFGVHYDVGGLGHL
ncbi:LysR substrate-binding domain-containing protein [Metabacillus sp. RGM 3146]|uniref:LysR substrate-binding domain-containing protein n=1 Tax=Metabacillus sp. RGM 3146 TaxID=3401092 RepID=UPI003B99C262